MIFTRNKLDTKDHTILNKLVAFGGDIKYSNGLFIWNSKSFSDVKSMEKHMEKIK
tara:strand:+ start:296 stop:460 length:165 start_codon:yes stop_codon:yes gene_type:complete